MVCAAAAAVKAGKEGEQQAGEALKVSAGHETKVVLELKR